MTCPPEIPAPDASRAVLIGVSEYDPMHPLPTVANNLQRLKDLLTAPDLWGLPEENCIVLLNPRDTVQVLDAVQEAAAEAKDALLVYFAGHGLLNHRDDLYLALSSSHRKRTYSGVYYDDLRHELIEATASSRMVILDCCYSGAWMDGYMSSNEDVVERAVVEGTYVMTASAETKKALAPPNEPYTAFTGELIRALEQGIPGGPDPLSMDALFWHIRAELHAKHRPLPQQRARNGGGAIVLTRNRWAFDKHRLAEEAARLALLDEEPRQRNQTAENVPRRGWTEWAQWEEPPASSPPRRLQSVQRMLDRLLPSNPWRRRLTQGLLALALVGSLAAGGLYTFNQLGHDECAKGVMKISGECIGVTDGSYAFASDLANISSLIQKENQRVQQSGIPSVSIALMTSMTAGTSEAETEGEQVRHKLEGAYLAQLRANNQDGNQMVRLLLANPGRNDAHWKSVVDQLTGLANSSDNLRAVAGLDSGLHATSYATRVLSQRRIPMVTSAQAAVPRTTDDGEVPVDGLARVLPSLAEQEKALASALPSSAKGAVIVWEKNESDPYSQSLNKAFAAASDTLPSQALTYAPPTDDGSDQAMEIRHRTIAQSICQNSEIETIYYAGRALPLRNFLESLGDNSACQDRKLTIISGPDAAALAANKPPTPFKLPGSGEITMYYPTAFHPDSWRTKNAPKTGGSIKDTDKLLDVIYRDRVFGSYMEDARLTEGAFVATYDAVLTAVTGIRYATMSVYEAPSPESVAAAWPALNGQYRVQGASGWICLDHNGNARNKAVPIARLTFDRSDSKSAVDLFKVAWPEGKPPGNSCTLPDPQ